MIRAVLIDDEPLALQRLEKLLRDSGEIEVVGAFVHASEALAGISAAHPDVFFLDIEMPDTDGMTLADELLSLDPEAQIVFVTAYNEYAIEAFELNALDYLLKPVRKDRLQKSLERIGKRERKVVQRQLKVSCLDGFRVGLADGENSTLSWRTAKAQELFAFLVHCRGHAVSRQTILDVLWDHLDAARATAHFHTTLYYLRKNLDSAGFAGLINHRNGLYWLNVKRIACDYYEFEALTSSQTDEAEWMERLHQSIRLYQRRYLDGHSWLWAESTRQRLEERYIALAIQLYEEYITLMDIPAAIRVLQDALHITPFDETIHANLISAHLMVNDRVAALRQYESLTRILKSEYGMEPSESLRSRFKQS